MSLTLREADHTYWLDGQQLPSVSKIIAPVCGYSFVDEEVMERKSAIGGAVHKLAEWHDKGEEIDPDSIDAAVLPYFKAWQDFTSRMRPKWTLIEESLHHEKHRYAGTPDRVGRLGGRPGDNWLLDLKCVATIGPHTGLQLAAYADMLEPGLRRGAVHLRPDGKWKLVEFADPMDKPAFLSLLTIHNWKTKHGLHRD